MSPNMVVMAPSDEAELFHMVATAAAIDDRPSCFRYPRGNGIGVELPVGNKGIPLEVTFKRVSKIYIPSIEMESINSALQNIDMIGNCPTGRKR